MRTATANDIVKKNLVFVLDKIPKNKDYYSLREIFTRDALYYMIFGERSNGKTYSVLELSIWAYAHFGYELGIIRRNDEDFRGKRGGSMFENQINNNVVSFATNGEWTDIYYYSSRWYFCKYENGKRIVALKPFAYAFALSTYVHDKSISFPNIKIILFDEFLAREGYLNEEFVAFTNTLSTIIRERGDVIIFMCGNTVNQFCPYFTEMGLTNVRKMKQGDIDTYVYGEEEELTVVVQYCGDKKAKRKKKKSDKYFAFNNPKLNMIKNGAWEIGMYPHLPVKYKRDDILFTYFIQFNEFILQCEIILLEDNFFTYIHKKTSPLWGEETDIIFTTSFIPKPNYRRKITLPVDELGRKILWFYKNDKVFYQDNEVGEIVRNYLMWSKTERSAV